MGLIGSRWVIRDMAPLSRAHTAETRVFRCHYDPPIRQRAV